MPLGRIASAVQHCITQHLVNTIYAMAESDLIIPNFSRLCNRQRDEFGDEFSEGPEVSLRPKVVCISYWLKACLGAVRTQGIDLPKTLKYSKVCSEQVVDLSCWS